MNETVRSPARRGGERPHGRLPRGGEVDLTWIAVSHRSASDLARLLPSLDAAREAWARSGFTCELIVVDNGSDDGSAACAERLAPDATVVRHEHNPGYGSAANVGARQARGRWLACSNADVHVPRGGLDALPDLLARLGDDVALLGPRIRLARGGVEASCGHFPTLARMLTGRVRDPADIQPHDARVVDWLTGACLFARREALLSAGGFDERFFLYYEDVDLAQRLKRTGSRAVFHPDLHVVHRHPHVVRGRVDATLEAVVRASRTSYFRKHRPSWERWALAALHSLEARLPVPRGVRVPLPAPSRLAGRAEA